ncbi:MAG: salicylate hydroxylase [Paraglaciecola sp.]|jgi:salicylate hydroxylase
MTKRILIAGGGIGGLCAALALQKKGFSVQIFEQSSALKEVGAGIQLSPNAMHVLQKLDLSQQLAPLAFRPVQATMRHYQTGAEFLRMPLGKTAEDNYGAPYLHIHRADLHQVLYQAAIERGVELHLDTQVAGYRHLQQAQQQQVQLVLQDGRHISGDVLIGADGIRSKIKACMFGDSKLDFSGQVAWRATVEASKLPPGLVKPDANLWVGPGGHIVSYYVRGGAQINLVAVQERQDWSDVSWNVPGDVEQLRHAFSTWHPEVVELVNAVQSCFLWGLFTSKPLSSWVDGQVTLLGDACHPMLPFVAQGAAMAIEDGYTLASELAQLPRWQAMSIEQALRSYQSARLERVTKVQKMAANNANLYHMKGASAKAKLSILKCINSVLPQLAMQPIKFIYQYNNTQN